MTKKTAGETLLLRRKEYSRATRQCGTNTKKERFMEYPYTDGNMVYDYKKHRYILTADYLQNVLSVDVNRFKTGTVNEQSAINVLLDNISLQVYTYVYAHNNIRVLRYIMAKMPSARDILMEAMGQQALYVLSNGDFTKAAEESKRRNYLDIVAKSIIDNTELSETGATLTYIGRYNICVQNLEEGGY